MARRPNRLLDVHQQPPPSSSSASTASSSSAAGAVNGHAIPPAHQPHSKQQNHVGNHYGGSSGSGTGTGSGSGSGYISTAIPTLHLSSPQEESTRLQLQRQRLREQYGNALVSSKIPGFKTSTAKPTVLPLVSQACHLLLLTPSTTAFFASLRTNLRLNASPPPSPMSTPPSMRGSATSLPPPSPLATPQDSAQDTSMDAASPTDDPLAGVPELRSYRTDDDKEKLAALKLVADSIAQMRQTANSILISHPINLACAVGVVSLVARYLYDTGRDPLMVGFACMGLVMIFFALCRYATQQYLFAAEDVTWDWLEDADVFVTKFGDEIIGSLIVEWVSGEGRQKRKRPYRGEIRGWTVRLKYRKKGVGSALLEDAVKEAKSKGAESIGFAEDHANSLRVLPKLYNKSFDQRERKAEELLQDIYEASPGRGKRR